MIQHAVEKMDQPPTAPTSKRPSRRIVYLTAGAASRFCGSCLHDNGLAKALIAQGEDVLLVPTFTPLRTDEENVSVDRLFFGGVNVYLQQVSAVFRHTPWFFDRLLDSPSLLNWLSQRSAGMDAAKLGPLTVSTLQGEHGHQRKEMDKLVEWLEAEAKPSIIHLSNALLLGMAGPLRNRLGVSIVCGLAGEDWFVEQLKEPHYSQVRELLREQAGEVDRFVAYNNYFADFMAEYMSIPRSKIEVIPHGLNLDGYPTARQVPSKAEFTIGYFGRVAVEKGLHILIEAFGELCQDPALPPLRLKIGGYKSSGDEPYYATLQEQVEKLNIADRFEYVGELDRAQKIAFLQSLNLMAVATTYHESKGLSVLESLANGVPVVAPRHGAFPEMLEQTGGGLLFEPNNPAELAKTLRSLILNPELTASLGSHGQAGIHRLYTAEKMAAAHQELYRRLPLVTTQ
jgi:glycosyltransferase involved in cell wall biosynthesis